MDGTRGFLLGLDDWSGSFFGAVFIDMGTNEAESCCRLPFPLVSVTSFPFNRQNLNGNIPHYLETLFHV